MISRPGARVEDAGAAFINTSHAPCRLCGGRGRAGRDSPNARQILAPYSIPNESPILQSSSGATAPCGSGRPPRTTPPVPERTMHTHATQRQYDEIIAPHYDVDPQSVIG